MTKLSYIGNCVDAELVEQLFGSVTDLAQLIEKKGNEFLHGNILVKYDKKPDIHCFFKKEQKT